MDVQTIQVRKKEVGAVVALMERHGVRITSAVEHVGHVGLRVVGSFDRIDAIMSGTSFDWRFL